MNVKTVKDWLKNFKDDSKIEFWHGHMEVYEGDSEQVLMEEWLSKKLREEETN